MMTRKPGDMHDEVPKLTRLFSDKERILTKESQWKYGLWHIAIVFFSRNGKFSGRPYGMFPEKVT